MKPTYWVRQTHRWISIAFTLGVIVNILAMSQLKGQEKPAVWVGLTALIPLGLLLISGLYMFVQPYAARLRGGRRAAGAAPPIAP